MSRQMLTSKEELFVQELVKGKSQREAYKAAYNTNRMKEASIDQLASRLFKKVKVRSRYEEIIGNSRAKTQDDAESIRAFIIQELKKMASGEVCDETIDYDKDGNVLRKRRTVKASDKQAAMNKLAEYYGVAPEVQTAQDITVTLKGLEEYAE